MTCSRRVSRALMMRAAAGEMKYRRVRPGLPARCLPLMALAEDGSSANFVVADCL